MGKAPLRLSAAPPAGANGTRAAGKAREGVRLRCRAAADCSVRLNQRVKRRGGGLGRRAAISRTGAQDEQRGEARGSQAAGKQVAHGECSPDQKVLGKSSRQGISAGWGERYADTPRGARAINRRNVSNGAAFQDRKVAPPKPPERESMKHRTCGRSDSSCGRRGERRAWRRVCLAGFVALFLAVACARETPESVVRYFVAASVAGDHIKQVALLTELEREWATHDVLSRWYPLPDIANFELDSVGIAPRQPYARPDTVMWLAWGSEPNWSLAPPAPTTPGGAPSLIPKEPVELLPAEVADLPRVTTAYEVWLTRQGTGSWRVTVQAERLAPLFQATDSLHKCGWGKDPRPCRATATRALSLASTLRIVSPSDFGRSAQRILDVAGMVDSMSVERTRTWTYNFSGAREFEWVVHNRSSRPASGARIRIVDADGIEVTRTANTSDIPARGRVFGRASAPKDRYTPPFKYEVVSVYQYDF